MIDVATTGRLAKAPKLSATRTGKSMASATIAVAGRGADAQRTWVRIVAFEQQADELATAEPGNSSTSRARSRRGSGRPTTAASRGSI